MTGSGERGRGRGREGERERERILKHPSRVPFPLVGDAADLLFL
jgi:hypothetical protein